jgi:nitric oxide dioxygenase
MGLTSQQAEIITATVPILEEHGRHITDVFYENMLREVPELNSVFNQSHQVSGNQSRALSTALYAYAANINNLNALEPALRRITQKHVSLYVRPEQYDIVGQYLLAAMQQVLGAALTPEILEAWKAAYGQIADLMINREAQLYQKSDGWTDWRDMKIAKKVRESEEVTSFYLEPCDGKPLPPFLPGQYISVQTEVSELKYRQARQYSLSEAPTPDHYRISVKRERGLDAKHPDAPARPGYISNTLHDHKEAGDIVQVSHPAGEFFLDVTDENDHAPVVLLSAGIGLTPLLSILDSLIENGDKRKISWVHTARNSKVHAFKEHIQKRAIQSGNMRKEVFISHPSEQDKKGEDYDIEGHLDLKKLNSTEDLMLHDVDTKYYICGPESFMADLEEALRGRGVDPNRINIEIFGAGKT